MDDVLMARYEEFAIRYWNAWNSSGIPGDLIAEEKRFIEEFEKNGISMEEVFQFLDKVKARYLTKS